MQTLMNVHSILFLVLFLCMAGPSGYSQGNPAGSTIRIYNYPMNPRLHPDDARRWVKPPDAGTFGNRIQFMALRSLDDDYKKALDNYTIKYKLGNIIWPSYPLIYRKDLPEIVQELKRRNLWLFDLWGYVPGSGPGGYWQQFVVPQGALDLFEEQLGDRWLGMDNGEQDGRYVGGFAGQLHPVGGSREQQYLNFQNHFQGLTDNLGNKMACLVSLNFGHYFLKEGVYTLIGAETAQGLPNTQIYYSFIRGAGKQYGVPWFGNASVWNRWGWKNYSGVTSDHGGDTEGTSLSLLKRLIYSHIMYDCVAAGFESSFLNSHDELSPIGKIQQSAVKWANKYGDPGVMYTPVAVMLDFFSGWSFPRHLYSRDLYRVWGNLPYDQGDYLTDGILDLLYPGYRDASYFHDETGFITPTPYGDAADCILSDCPLWMLQQYPVVVIGGKLKGDREIKDKLEAYIQTGGRLMITSGSLENIPGGLCGITTGKKVTMIAKGAEITMAQNHVTEADDFESKQLVFPSGSKVIASYNQEPLAVEGTYGAGKLTVFASPFGITAHPQHTDVPGTDQTMTTPFPLTGHVKAIMDDVFSSTRLFRQNEGLSMITCRKSKGEYTLALCNNTWQEKPFDISSDAGRIMKVTELPLDCSEQKAVGFLPKNVTSPTGKNGPKTIAGGDIRIFSVKMEEKHTEDIPFIQPVANPVNRGLALRNISSLKQEILLRPTFFQHFDRAMIDWKYLSEKEPWAVTQEAGWIKRQGLKVIVDFSSGINLFPDLRLVNNDSLVYDRSIAMIRSVIDKMSLAGAGDMVLTTHRSIENNFTQQDFSKSLVKTLKEISVYAAKSNINVHLRLTGHKNPNTIDQANNLAVSVSEPNFFIAPSLALLLDDPKNGDKISGLLKNLQHSIVFVSAPQRDRYGKVWNLGLPGYQYDNKEEFEKMVQLSAGKVLITDAVYTNKEEEYKDISYLNRLLK